MIKKAQIKFISIIMTILFGFFAVISGVAIFALRNANNRNIDRILDEMINTLSLYETSSIEQSDSFILRFYQDSSLYDLIFIDEEAFSESEITQLISEVKKHPIAIGRVDNIYYKLATLNQSNYLVGYDATEFLDQLSNSVLRMFLIFLGVYVVLFIIVYLFSFTVFEPIKENLAKQKQFISNASHELKTPLTIISANADVLKQTISNQWLDNIKDQTERLEGIITDMLEMAKIDEGVSKLVKEDFNLSDEIIKTVLPFDALAFEKGKALELDILPNVIYKGNKESVKQILNILLDNAVKYASNDGLIKVTLTKKNGKSLLCVYNTGSAVPDKQADKIFERFYRFENSRSRETGGSGLGLSIAKEIAIANKWKISATSKQNEYMIINIIF